MKKLILLLALTFSTAVFTSCREERSGAENAAEDAAEGVEDAVDDTGDAIEDAADDL